MKKYPSDTPSLDAQKSVSNPDLRLLSSASGSSNTYQRVIAAITPSIPGQPSAPVPKSASPYGVRRSTLAYCAEKWVLFLTYKGQSPKTVRGKADIVDKLSWWLEREGRTSCDTSTLMEFVQYIRQSHREPGGRWNNPQERKEVCARTVQLYVQYLRSFFRYIATDDVLEQMVHEEERIAAKQIAFMDVPPAPKRIIPALNADEVAMVISAATEHSRVKERDLSLIWFLLDSGARIAEACALNVSDFDFKSGRVEVLGKGNKRRTLLFGDDTIRALATYWQKWSLTSESPAFCAHYGQKVGGPLSTNAGLKIFQRLRVFCNIPGKRISPHTMRHSFATLYIESGGSDRILQMLLGHESREMTDRYVHLSMMESAQGHRHSPARAVMERLQTKGRPRR